MKQANQKIWCVSSVLTLILTLLVSLTHAQAPLPTFSQGSLTAFPVDNQLYPRVLPVSLFPRGYANVTISGIMNQGTFDGVRVRIYRDNDGDGPGGFSEITGSPIQVAINTSTSAASFSLTHQLPSELFNYRYRLYGLNGGTQSAILAESDNVVAGDAFIIHGQSNAEASPWTPQDANAGNSNRGFVRVYGNSTEQAHNTMPKAWFIGNGNLGNRGGANTTNEGNVGQWGIRFATQIATIEQIPVCVFNGGYGERISYFQKNYSGGLGGYFGPQDNNYWRLLRRTQEAGLQNSIRSILWWQGESDIGLTNDVTITNRSNYFSALTNLFASFDSDYQGIETYVMFQIRMGCFNQSGDQTPSDGGFFDDYYGLDVMQAQFDFASSRNDIDLISTNGVNQHNQGSPFYCHYPYNDGYRIFGDRSATIIRQRLYGAPVANNTRSFGPIGADFTGTDINTGFRNQVSIRLTRPSDTYTLLEVAPNGLISNDIILEGNGTYNIGTISIQGDLLRINFTRGSATNDPTAISYFGHSGLREGSLINGTLASPGGGAMYSFLNFPIQLGTLPIDPLSLTVSRTGVANTLRWKAEANERFEQFIVERGETRNSFKQIFDMYGTGQDGNIQYDFTDNKPNATVSHYRIRAIQQDGKELFSQVVTVNNRLNSVKEFRVYPNPVAGSANATINMNEAALATINLHDASGRLLSSRKLQLQKGNNQFSVGELLDYNPGTYIVRVVTPTETQQIRVVKAK